MALCLVCGWTSCSDEPDSEYFYTFTGEMMSDWLTSPERPQYSEFAGIVERAGLMDLLATYGQYTCFVPTNDAINEFLRGRGLTDISQLSDADCDTIARNHLVSKMYSTYDMTSPRLPTYNLMNRPLFLTPGFDRDSNAVIMIDNARIDFYLKDDSVENGIMQPVDMVIEKSSKLITDIMGENPRISTFYSALQATGVIKEVQEVEDPDWDPKAYEKYPYLSNNEREYAIVPKTKIKGYTFFVEPDDVLKEKCGIEKGDLRALWELACKIYDPVYPEDAGKPGHGFDQLTDSINPLHRFIQYHILNKKASTTADLTPIDITYNGSKTAIGIDETVHNPTDWHYTLLPHTMIKVERPTVAKYGGSSATRTQNYINRRCDDQFTIPGVHITEVETERTPEAVNGYYFYVDDVIGFSQEVQNTVQNIRIRMDFNAIFPEIIGNNLRSAGSPTSTSNEFDESGHNKYGDYYYFPMGYLKDVTFNEGCYFILRRPKIWFNIYQWDEMNLKGDYDITFKLPPVPFSGEWQLRLGFTVYHDGADDRGVAQVYVDNIPQGIPLDMRQDLSTEMYLGDSFSGSNYNSWTDEQKAEQQKTLKNLGAYIYPIGLWRDVGSKGYCHTEYQNMRRVLCQTYLDANKDHYLRMRKTNDGNPDDTFMLDFLELVPKSVYGVDGEKMEDDL